MPSGNDKGVRALLLQIHCWMEKGSDQNCGEPATTGSVDHFCWEQAHGSFKRARVGRHYHRELEGKLFRSLELGIVF